MTALKLQGKSLVILDKEDSVTERAARNIPNVIVVLTNNVCVYDLLNSANVVSTPVALEALTNALKCVK